MTLRRLSRLQTTTRLLESLNALQRAWEARWRQICEEAAVPVSQAHALLCLAERGPVPMQELARILHVAPSTGTRIIEQMEKVGWVARSSDPEDRRRVLIHLLGAGEERAWTLQERAREALWVLAGGLPHPGPVIDSVVRLADQLSRENS